MAIAYGLRIRGTSARAVVCEECATEYGYVLEREVGHGSLVLGLDWERRQAEKRARRLLEEKLRCDIAPCPKCGWIQSDMVAWSKGRRLRGLDLVGASFLGLAVCLGVFNTAAALGIPWVVVLGVAAFGLSIVGLRRALMALHDPNRARVEKRLARARGISLPRSEFEQRVRELRTGGPGAR